MCTHMCLRVHVYVCSLYVTIRDNLKRCDPIPSIQPPQEKHKDSGGQPENLKKTSHSLRKKDSYCNHMGER